MNRRHWSLGAVLVATVAAAVGLSGPEESGTARAVPAPTLPARTAAPAATATPAGEAPPAAEAPREFGAASGDPFASRNWAPPVVQRPAPPVAPPLPYAYFGRMNDGRDAVVFLQRGDRTYTAKRGDTLDPEYRIADITDDAIVIVYLPLKQRQSLSTGS